MKDIIFRFDPDHPQLAPPASPEEARRRLEEGNHEFFHFLEADESDQSAAPRIIPFNLADIGAASVPGAVLEQKPFAVVLGCSDARVPIELIFNQGCNDLFVVRVAGNVLGSECLGSMDYALDHLGASVKVLVVLGHSGCGAVTAAVDAFLHPARYLSVASSHPLRAIVDRILVPVRGATRVLEMTWGAAVTQRPGYRRALIEATVVLNAALTAAMLHQEFRHKIGPDLQVVYGVYELVSRRIRLPMAAAVAASEELHLVAPPAHEADFVQLGLNLAGSDDIRRLLESE